MSMMRFYRPRRVPAVFDQMEQMAREMSRLMPWAAEGDDTALGIPVDVYETEEEVVVKASVPGIKKEDLEINLQENTLTISGQSSEETEVTEEGYYRKEIRSGSFFRAINLPVEVRADEVSATCDQGVCVIRAPKVKDEKTGRKVEVQ